MWLACSWYVSQWFLILEKRNGSVLEPGGIQRFINDLEKEVEGTLIKSVWVTPDWEGVANRG